MSTTKTRREPLTAGARSRRSATSARASHEVSTPVFAPHVDEVVIMASVPGDPPDADDRVRVVLDPDDPTRSIAIIPDPKADPPAD